MNRSLLFIEEIENPEHKLMLGMMHELVRTLIPQIKPVFKWNCPFFDYCGAYFCYMYVSKNRVVLSFVNCQELVVPLHYKQEKKITVHRVFVENPEMIASDEFAQMILEAAIIHESKNKKDL